MHLHILYLYNLRSFFPPLYLDHKYIHQISMEICKQGHFHNFMMKTVKSKICRSKNLKFDGMRLLAKDQKMDLEIIFHKPFQNNTLMGALLLTGMVCVLSWFTLKSQFCAAIHWYCVVQVQG